jgi:N-acyl-D-amino-acid deacylase
MNKNIQIALPPGIHVVILLACLLLASLGNAQTPTFDLVITHGHIIDGTGSPWYSGDLGIRDGKIAAIGNLSAAPRKRTIDAAGKVVAPGFIDMLGQSEMTILVDPRLPSKIFQGITSEITGEGNSAAPLSDAIIQSGRGGYEHFKITPDWRTFRQYFARLEKQGMGINLAFPNAGSRARRHERRRRRRLHVARVHACALCQDRRTDRARHRGRKIRRHLCHAHAR